MKGKREGEKNSFPYFTSVIHTLLTTEEKKKKKGEATSIQKVAVENFSSSSSVSIPLGLAYRRTTAPPKSCRKSGSGEKRKKKTSEHTRTPETVKKVLCGRRPTREGEREGRTLLRGRFFEGMSSSSCACQTVSVRPVYPHEEVSLPEKSRRVHPSHIKVLR